MSRGTLLRSQGRLNRGKKRGLVAYRYEAKSSDCQPCVRKLECCPGTQSRGGGILRLEESAAVRILVSFSYRGHAPRLSYEVKLKCADKGR